MIPPRRRGERPVREVLDIRQAARYLQISADTLYKYAAEGYVPGFKLGKGWRFRRSRLDEWMDEQANGGNDGSQKNQPG